ncbi:MAG TPA: hypothetical protein VHA53_07575, partial [Nitrolancea sp.]|nr:hypothetical protein [Nitrolancea sp.]
MDRRISFFVLGFVLMLAAGAMLVRPTGVLADTTFPDCPTLSDLQAAVTAGGTITFGTANCTLTVDTSILVGDNTTVTINGNGLTLNGTDDVTVLKFSPTGTNLTLVDTTIKGGNGGIVCELTSLGCFTATTNTSQVTLTNSSVNSGVGFPYNLSLTDSTVSGPGIVAEGPVTLTRSTVKSGGLMTMGLGDDPIMLTGSTVKGGAIAVSNQGAGSIT